MAIVKNLIQIAILAMLMGTTPVIARGSHHGYGHHYGHRGHGHHYSSRGYYPRNYYGYSRYPRYARYPGGGLSFGFGGHHSGFSLSFGFPLGLLFSPAPRTVYPTQRTVYTRPAPQSYYRPPTEPRGDCRDTTHMGRMDGKLIEVHAIACRQSDGTYRLR